MCGRLEILGDDLGQDPGGGPGAHSGHRHQDHVKRVVTHQLFDLDGDVVTLGTQRGQLLGKLGQHDPGGTRARHHDGLLAQYLRDLLRESRGQARGSLGQPGGDPLGPGGGQVSWGRPDPDQVQHGWMVQMRAKHMFESGMDLSEQTAQSVRRRCDLRAQVVVESAEHRQLGGLLVVEVDRTQRVGHGTSRLGDDRRVSGVGLGLPRVQVCDPAHRQPGQVAHQDAGVPGDSDRQSADRGRLVHDHQHPAMGAQVREDSSQLGLVVRQRLVVQNLAAAVEGHRVMVALAYVEADEDVDLLVPLDHR